MSSKVSKMRDAQAILPGVLCLWLDSHGLILATEKTELPLLTGKRILLNIEMRVCSETLCIQSSVKDLGVKLDPKLKYWAQIQQTATKASQTTASLSRLMANISGLLASKRTLLMSVKHSILLYGSEIWADTLKTEHRRKQLAAGQRMGAFRVASTYRTVSEPAILVFFFFFFFECFNTQGELAYNTKSCTKTKNERQYRKER